MQTNHAADVIDLTCGPIRLPSIDMIRVMLEEYQQLCRRRRCLRPTSWAVWRVIPTSTVYLRPLS